MPLNSKHIPRQHKSLPKHRQQQTHKPQHNPANQPNKANNSNNNASPLKESNTPTLKKQEE
jgi:hypothetical protein